MILLSQQARHDGADWGEEALLIYSQWQQWLLQLNKKPSLRRLRTLPCVMQNRRRRYGKDRGWKLKDEEVNHSVSM